MRDEYFKESTFNEMKEFLESILLKNEDNKPVETINEVPEVGGSQYGEFRDLSKNPNLTNVKPRVQQAFLIFNWFGG